MCPSIHDADRRVIQLEPGETRSLSAEHVVDERPDRPTVGDDGDALPGVRLTQTVERSHRIDRKFVPRLAARRLKGVSISAIPSHVVGIFVGKLVVRPALPLAEAPLAKRRKHFRRDSRRGADCRRRIARTREIAHDNRVNRNVLKRPTDRLGLPSSAFVERNVASALPPAFDVPICRCVPNEVQPDGLAPACDPELRANELKVAYTHRNRHAGPPTERA